MFMQFDTETAKEHGKSDKRVERQDDGSGTDFKKELA